MSGGDLICKIDRFNGVLIDTSEQSLSTEDFLTKLKEAITKWKSEGKRGLWVTAQKEQACVIPLLIELGFDFHHAKTGYVCLTKWLPEDIPNHIPGYASHYLGVAGFVVNSQNELLVIREKYHARNALSLWKLPGGLADAGEEIPTTAVREVKEETGVDTEFVCIIAYRHMHNYRHGCSDFYTACLLRPVTTEISACPMEIEECKWMNIDEYESLDCISEVNQFFVKRYREIVSNQAAITGSKVLSFDKKSLHTVYSVGHVQL